MKLPSQVQNKPEIQRVVASFSPSDIAFYVSGNDGGGWDAEDITYKVTPKETKKLPDFSPFRNANLSPDGKRGVFGSDKSDTVIVREIIGDQFGQQIIISGKK